ncbi:MFS transporter [Nocardioides litoris]|uniref:MFS transporter n=1 Tax=Nocardioides litoris TaxID=1926648 RepID=UPI00111F7590|nr:MFS transporter [Nocardioides litoris]
MSLPVPPARAHEDPAALAGHRGLVAVVAAATLLVLMAFTAPLAAVGPIAESLGAGVAGRAWVLSSMSIGLAAALLPAGAVADELGRRRTFAGGLALLALGLLASTAATSTGVFVAARVVQGLGGAAVTAAGLGMLAHHVPAGPARATATGMWGASVGAGIALGPLVAALSDGTGSWRTCYAAMTMAALGLAAVVATRLEESRHPEPRGVGVVSAALLAAGVSALLAGLVEGRRDWTAPLPLLLLVVAAVLVALVVLVERRSARPLVEPGVLRSPRFLVVVVAAFVLGTGPIALFSYLAAFTGPALGYSVVLTAVLLLGWSATSVVLALLARRIPASVSGRTQLGWSLVVVGLGLATLAGVPADAGWARLLPGMVVAGVATGVINAALGREAVASVPVGRGGVGSGATNTARYLGSAVGVTVVAVLVNAHGPDPADLRAGWTVAVAVCAGGCLLGAALIAALRPRGDT